MQGKDTANDWERNRKKTLLEYLPKLILVGFIWITTVLVYMYVRVKQTGDPSYSSIDDLSTFTYLKACGFMMATIYFLWLGYLIVGSFRHIEGMSIEYRFILGMTLATILGSVTAVYTGALAPDQHGAKVFTCFFGMFNMYVLLLAFSYTPVGSAYGNILPGDDDELEMVDPIKTMGSGKEDDNTFTIEGMNRQTAV
ncbi:unnamed protein product [Discosporangium mesarthrocarpum]